MIREFLLRHLYTIVIPALIIVVITILLILLSGGPQKGAFQYQIF